MTTQTLLAPITLPFAGFFSAFARAIAFGTGAQARFDEVQRLQALSDEALAELGIARDDIVRHVYADLLAS